MRISALVRTRPGPVGLTAIGLAALLWAVAATTASNLFDNGVEPLELAAARSLISAVGLAVVTRVVLSVGTRRTSPRLRLRIVGLGLCIALVNASYYVAIERLAVAPAVVIQYIAPALVVAYVALRAKRRPSPDITLSLTGAIAGVVLVAELPAGEVGRLDGVGIMMALASAFLFASYTLLSEDVASSLGTMRSMFYAFVVASAFWIAWQSTRGWPGELFDPANIGEVLYVGVAGTLMPFLLYVWGTQRVRAERASIAATLEPVLAAAVAWMWLGETLSIMQTLGGILVIVSVLALQIRHATLRKAEP